MYIIIVGAGIGGLSAALSLSLAGHKVTLVEAASQLAEVGAGVQLTPCATKWLWRWGLDSDILAAAVLPEAFTVRSAENGELLGKVEFGDFQARYDGPYLVIHRADLHSILHEHAVRAGAEVRLNSRVLEYDMEGGGIKLKDGTEIYADLVVAADGINSNGRKQLVDAPPDDNGLQKTGFAAFRMLADVSKVQEDPLTALFVASQNCNCITGEGSTIMTYMIKGDRKLNLVLSHLDDVDTSQWSQDEFRSEINRIFKDYTPAAKALIDVAFSDTSQRITNWPINEVEPLESWISSSGKFVLMGDAAHAMSFFLSMGVSLAVEDAAALVECLSLYEQTESNNGDLHRAVKVFQSVRLQRAGIVRDASLHASQLLHMPAGPERELRDRALATQGASINDTREYDEDGRHFATTRPSYGIIDQKIRDCFYAYNLKEHVQTEWIASKT